GGRPIVCMPKKTSAIRGRVYQVPWSSGLGSRSESLTRPELFCPLALPLALWVKQPLLLKVFLHDDAFFPFAVGWNRPLPLAKLVSPGARFLSPEVYHPWTVTVTGLTGMVAATLKPQPLSWYDFLAASAAPGS